MDTDALLDMSLDAIISKNAKPRGAGGSGGGGAGGGRGGKVRSTGRVGRMQQSQPYMRESGPRHAGGTSNNKVYVGNLDYGVTWKELKDCMAQSGNVVKADVGADAGGRSKGYGLVVFRTAADAQAAINTLQDFNLMGRPIFLREYFDEPQSMSAPGGRPMGMGRPAMGMMGRPAGGGFGGGGAGTCKVFVSNLPYECDWKNLKDYMRNAGNVLRADVFVGVDGRSKGLGTVEFSKPYEARNAITQLSETELMGRPILVREDRGDSGNFGHGVGGSAGARVFVGNLAWEVQWQDLKDCMRQAGNVKFVDLFQQAGGRSKGCAVVEYETPQEAHMAIRDLHDTELMGRLMFVREDREEGSAASKSMGPMGQKNPGAEGRQVFVGNLSWEIGWQDLKDVFKQVGVVQFVEIPEDAQGRSKGHGTVRFASEEGAIRAIDELNDTEFGGRRIFVREDNQL